MIMVTNILIEVLSVRDDAIKNSPLHEVLIERINALRKVASEQKLKRDEYCIKNTINAVLHKINTVDTVFCYVHDNVIYPTQQVNGFSTSTEDLLGREYSSEVWDSFGKITIWKNSGELYSLIKEEDNA